MLNYDEIMKDAGERYIEKYAERAGMDLLYTAPECLPRGIISEQVKSVALAIVNAINAEKEREKPND